MKVTFWGTRGSLASPGPDTVRYGGNTACVQVESGKTTIVLDAGSGIRRLGLALVESSRRVDVLLSHLHVDHIQGLGFFEPLFNPRLEVHIWGPGSTTSDLRSRLSRYLSVPLFPVHLREIPCDLTLHDVGREPFQIGDFEVTADLICHPGPTLGYRLDDGKRTLAYLSDHEPALGARTFPDGPEWTSGFRVSKGVNLLIHDGQYTDSEYPDHVGWGHSSFAQVIAFADLVGCGGLAAFHHDPSHSDAFLDEQWRRALDGHNPSFDFTIAEEGRTIEL